MVKRNPSDPVQRKSVPDKNAMEAHSRRTKRKAEELGNG